LGRGVGSNVAVGIGVEVGEDEGGLVAVGIGINVGSNVAVGEADNSISGWEKGWLLIVIVASVEPTRAKATTVSTITSDFGEAFANAISTTPH
jgi:hypothetical protein